MKILHICTGFALSYNGGITNYVRALCLSQLEQGLEVSVVAREDERIGSLEVTGFKSQTVKPFSKHFDLHGTSDEALIEIIRKLTPDLIHFHMALDFSASTFEKIQALGVSYCVSLHDYYYICPRIIMVTPQDTVCRVMEEEKCKACIGVTGKFKKAKRILPKSVLDGLGLYGGNVTARVKVLKTFLMGASTLLPVSKRVEEIYRDFAPDAHYHTLHIGNNSAYAFPDTVALRDGPIVVALLGALSYHKGAAVLEGLLRRVDRGAVEFRFYGRANSVWLNKLVPLGLNNCGEYRHDALSELLQDIDIGLVLPIWEDNGPQVTMEFINHRIPVLGTKRGGIPDFIQDNNGIVFDPDEAGEVDGVVNFLNDLDRHKISGMKEKMTRLKTPEEHAEEVFDLYKATLAGGKHVAR